MTDSTAYFKDTDRCVDAVIAKIGNDIRVGAPIALGKPNHLLNAFYRRAKQDPALRLTILTGLSVNRPKASSTMEKRFLEPFMDRVFGNCPDLDYLDPLIRGHLPDNVEIVEFYLRPGGFLDNAHVQQNYINSNYTHVGRDLILQGINVYAQAIAKRTIDGDTWYSLSSNADSLDLFPLMREQERQGKKIAIIGQVNENLPFMYHDAMVAADTFHMVIDDRRYDHTLFGPPAMPVETTDYLIGLNASTLVKDGGTLQIGIGSLGDAIAYGCRLRHQHNDQYRSVIADLGVQARSGELITAVGGIGVFDLGLYGASEMLADGFRHLYHAGVLSREVYADATLQRLLNEGVISKRIDPEILDRLREHGAIGDRLSRRDFDYLQRFGILKEGLGFEGGVITTRNGNEIPADLADTESAGRIKEECLGHQLINGIVLHAGFFLGPQAMYADLRAMDEEERKKFCMTGVGFVNQLYGCEELATLQRRHARFINTTMKVTLLGAACSDALESGQEVSGVGGQYNFVAMGHALAEARSILALRSTRTKGDTVTSNINWSYGYTTIPRHLRDIVVTEYGIADLRGKRDKEVIAALLNIADSRFQQPLLTTAKNAGKLPADYAIPAEHRNNTPERIEAVLANYRQGGLFPDFPFGTDLTPEELVLGKALKALKAKMRRKSSMIKTLVSAIDTAEPPDAAKPYLARLKLDEPTNFKEKVIQKMLVSELIGGGHI
jgi:acyl-CoA hydrolase